MKVKDSRHIITESQLRSIVSEHLLQRKGIDSNIIKEGLGPNWLKRMISAISRSDKSRIKFFEALDEAPAGRELKRTFKNNRLGIAFQDWLLQGMQWIVTPASMAARRFLAGRTGRAKELRELLGDNLHVLDDLGPNSTASWNDIIPPERAQKWIDAGILERMDISGRGWKVTNRAGTESRTIDAWMGLRIDGKLVPLPESFHGNLAARPASWGPTKLVKKNDSPVFDTTLPATGDRLVGQWQQSVRIDDLPGKLKYDGKTFQEIAEMMPKSKRALLLYLYWGQMVPLEVAIWSQIIGQSGGQWVLDELNTVLMPSSKVSQMFSREVYDKCISAGMNLQDSNISLVQGISVGGGLWYVKDLGVSVARADDYTKLSGAYDILLSLDNSLGSGAFENIRTAVNLIKGHGADVFGGDDVVTDADLAAAIKKIDPALQAKLVLEADKLERLKIAWQAIQEINDVTTADFSYCFRMAFADGRASFGTRHYFRDLFGEGLSVPKYSDVLGFDGPVESFIVDYGGLAGMLAATAVKNIGRATTSAEEIAQIEQQANADAQKFRESIEATAKFVSEAESLQDAISLVYDDIKDLNVGFPWDLSDPSNPTPKTDRALTIDDLKDIASIKWDDENAIEKLGAAAGQGLVNAMTVPDVVDRTASPTTAGASSGEEGQPGSSDLSVTERTARKSVQDDADSIVAIATALTPYLTKNIDRTPAAGMQWTAPADTNWPSRLARGSDASDDYSGYTIKELVNGNINPASKGTQGDLEYIRNYRKLCATLSMLVLVWGEGTVAEAVSLGQNIQQKIIAIIQEWEQKGYPNPLTDDQKIEMQQFARGKAIALYKDIATSYTREQ